MKGAEKDLFDMASVGQVRAGTGCESWSEQRVGGRRSERESLEGRQRLKQKFKKTRAVATVAGERRERENLVAHAKLLHMTPSHTYILNVLLVEPQCK